MKPKKQPRHYEVYPSYYALYRNNRHCGNYPTYIGFRRMLEKMGYVERECPVHDNINDFLKLDPVEGGE